MRQFCNLEKIRVHRAFHTLKQMLHKHDRKYFPWVNSENGSNLQRPGNLELAGLGKEDSKVGCFNDFRNRNLETC